MPEGIKIDPQVIIILVVLIFGALRWVFDQFKRTHLGGGEGEEQEEEIPSSPFEDMYREAQRQLREEEEEASRKDEDVFPEPAGGRSPEPVAQASAPPPLPPPVPAMAPSPGIPQFVAPSRPKLSTAEKAALERVQAGGLQTLRRPARRRSRSRVRALLSTPASTRDAIVLRDILGPPKGMA